jgi:hypothetical protein
MRAAMLEALTGRNRAAVHASRSIKGASFEAGGRKHAFRYEHDHPHSWAHLTRRGRVRVFHPAGPAFQRSFQLAKPDDAVYFHTVLTSDAPRVVRFVSRTTNAGVRAWLAGVPLAHQGRYRLDRGEYTLLAEVSPGKKPQAPDLCLDFQLVPAGDDAAADARSYHATLKWAEPYLRRVVKLKPDSPTAARAKQFLARLPSR